MLDSLKKCFGCGSDKTEKYLEPRPTVKQPSIVTPPLYFINQINIQMILNDKSPVNFKVSSSVNGLKLKEYIYNNISKNLSPQRMSLYHKNQKIQDQKMISQLTKDNNAIHLVQKKAAIQKNDYVSTKKCNPQGQCPYSMEKGTAKMSCGHQIGQQSLKDLIQSIIKSFKFEIRCPQTMDNGTTCNEMWNIKVCKLICAYDQKEFLEIQTKLSENSLKNLIKNCPKCNIQVLKIGLNSNRVVCPQCKSGDFCFDCLQPWKSPNNTFCGSYECQEYHKILANCPQKTFSLRTGQNYTNYNVPIYRSCFHCKSIIEHGEKCKHMKCKYCLNDFCFVCLSVPKNHKWTCGAPYEFCGKIAERQKLS